MNREAALHFRDEFREARAAAQRDAEAQHKIIVAVERLGAYLLGRIANLGKYRQVLTALAEHSPMATEVPSSLPELHTTFARKYEVIRKGRNTAVHEGAFARHLTGNAVEVSLVLEEALMRDSYQVGDFMVRNPVCAYLWQPLSFVRQTMLANSFSYLPVMTDNQAQPVWQVISDSRLARYLREEGEISKDLLIQSLSEALASKRLQLIPVQTCGPEDCLKQVLHGADGLPTLILSPNSGHLLGVLTPFDLL